MKHQSRSAAKKKRQKIVAIVAGAAVILGFLGYYLVGTPAWSMFQLYRAYKAHDIRGALKYVDVRSVLEHAAENLRTQLGLTGAQGGPAAASATVDEFIEALKPLLRERIQNRLLEAVADSEFERAGALAELKLATEEGSLGEQVSGRLFSIQRNGSDAVIEVRGGIRIGLRQTPDRYWRIVALDGLVKLTDEEKALLKSTVQQGELRELILDRIRF